MDKPKHLKIPLQAIPDSTQDFNQTNFLGKGGYGRVYKGILSWVDYHNLPVTVKQLDVTGFQGQKEFYTESEARFLVAAPQRDDADLPAEYVDLIYCPG
ncbi:hypothetical protein L6452_30308 [Arctium lappa]|uniref:Uncharacterized protein n=1 Tax=Arctium lappa TaxID=4217 RepID=A0ACB8ZHA9_ARCLA|nr:hypothetical protein L6452_30308 [Arctium lappa]